MPGEKWVPRNLPKRGLRETFEGVRKDAPEPAREQRTLERYTQDQLEGWRERLMESRETEPTAPHLAPPGMPGQDERVEREEGERERRQLISEIDAELMHRLMVEIATQHGDEGKADKGRGGFGR